MTKLLIQKSPNKTMLSTPDGSRDGNLPIHLAAKKDERFCLLKLLFADSSPETLIIPNQNRRLPIYLVAKYKCTKSVLYLARMARQTIKISCTPYLRE